MKCAICKNGETESGNITVLLERIETLLIFKKVPAEICKTCGEEYLDSETNNKLLKMANDASIKGVDLEILRFAA